MTNSVTIAYKTASGKIKEKNFSCVNPDAKNADLVTFGQKVAAVCNGSFEGATRIYKIDCESEPELGGDS